MRCLGKLSIGLLVKLVVKKQINITVIIHVGQIATYALYSSKTKCFSAIDKFALVTLNVELIAGVSASK